MKPMHPLRSLSLQAAAAASQHSCCSTRSATNACPHTPASSAQRRSHMASTEALDNPGAFTADTRLSRLTLQLPLFPASQLCQCCKLSHQWRIGPAIPAWVQQAVGFYLSLLAAGALLPIQRPVGPVQAVVTDVAAPQSTTACTEPWFCGMKQYILRKKCGAEASEASRTSPGCCHGCSCSTVAAASKRMHTIQAAA